MRERSSGTSEEGQDRVWTRHRNFRGTTAVHHRIGVRIMILVVAAAVLAGGVVGIATISASRDVLYQNSLNHNASKAQLIAGLTTSYMAAAEAHAMVFASRPEVRQAVMNDTAAQLQPVLANFVAVQTALESASILDANGTQVSSRLAVSTSIGQSYSDRDYFEQVVATGRPYLGSPAKSRVSGKTVITFAVPIFDDRAQLRGVFLSAISLANLSDIFVKVESTQDTHSSVVDLRHGGVTIADKDTASLLEPASQGKEVVSRLLANEAGAIRNSENMIGFAPVADLPWGVMVVTPIETTGALVSRLTREAGLITGIIVLLMAIVGGVLMLRIGKPLRRLMEGIRKIGNGDLGYAVTTEARDEIGDLSRAFGDMAAHLKTTMVSHDGLAIEVDERRKAEEDLRTSEHRLKQAQALGRIGSWEFDIDTQVISWSDETCVLYERDPKLGPPSPEEEARYYSSEQAKALRDHASKAIETGEPQEYDLDASLPGGKTAWLHSVMQPVKDAQGRVFKLSGTVQDIADRRLSETTLRKSEARYRVLAESISDVFLAMDRGLKYTYWNEASEKLTGIPAAEAVGKHFFEVFADNESNRSLANVYLEAIRTGQSRHVTVPYPGEQNLVHEISAYPSEDGVSVFVKDVTERVRQQERLLFSDAAFKSIHEAVFAMDEDTVVTHWNPICEDLFGIKSSEAMGKHFRELLSMVEDYPGQNQERIQLLKKNGYNQEEQLYRCPRGDVWLDVHSQAIEGNGRRSGWVTLALDITERKRADEEKRRLEEKAQMNSRLAAVGEMAAGIAHEINNPLTGVLGFSKLLLEKDSVPEQIKEELGIIADGSQRVADIVKRLLTFARQTKPMRTSANLNELLDNTLKLREYVLRTANIEVFLRLDPELPRSVVDPGQLQQVFMNLIVNAEQAMKEAHGKGTLVVTTEKKGHSIRIYFQDDGPGITHENMKRLFQPFFTTKAVGQGTGLGLSLSRSIVIEHGGELTVASEPGHGATFRIELPITEVPAEEPGVTSPTAKAEPAATAKGRILVVDDEPGIRELLKRILTKAGHSADTTADAGEAMDRLAGGDNYDVIVSDVRMPGMNGMELYAGILERAPAMAHRVMFVTGDVMGADVAAFLGQGTLPYLSKPFSNAEVNEKVDAILRAGQPGNESLDRSSL
jgi:PAS domain S-box-containing protein